MKDNGSRLLDKKRICLIISIFILMIVICLTIISNRSDKTFRSDGVIYALSVDGVSSTNFPTKGMYNVSLDCENANCKWDYENWKLVVSSITGKVYCDIDFVSVEEENLNSKIKGLSGTKQGNGEVVHEIATVDNSTFAPGDKYSQSDYSNVVNDTTYLWNWSDTDKTWTSSNKGDDAKSTTSAITFSPKTNGVYQLCYVQSSEAGYDYSKIHIDDVEKFSLKGKNVTSYECVNLGNLTTSSKIKVTYQKDSSGNTGKDEVSFYMQGGVYHEDIKSVDAGYRYEGKNPNNYVWFNNELWRIIGVFDESSHGVSGEELVKIIREKPIGRLAWDKSCANDWSASSLKALLNGAYLNREDGTESGNCYGYSTSVKANCDYTDIGIDARYRSMIENVTWYLGGHSDASVTVDAMYGYERGTTVYTGRPTSDTGQIGLMYVSDYGYASLASSCARTTNLGSYNNAKCAGENWLYGNGYTWMITPISSNSNIVFIVDDSGNVTSDVAYYGNAVPPVLYLKSNVYTYAGDGSKASPYIIGMK